MMKIKFVKYKMGLTAGDWKELRSNWWFIPVAVVGGTVVIGAVIVNTAVSVVTWPITYVMGSSDEKCRQ
jgi:hypothetical protein